MGGVSIWVFFDVDEHLEKLEKVLDSLREHDLLAKGNKCSLFRTEIEFLGFLVSANGTRPTRSQNGRRR